LAVLITKVFPGEIPATFYQYNPKKAPTGKLFSQYRVFRAIALKCGLAQNKRSKQNETNGKVQKYHFLLVPLSYLLYLQLSKTNKTLLKLN
jgi:hypothetical protein